MTTEFAVTFRTEAEYALTEITAATPEEALQQARQLWEQDASQFDFSSFDELQELQTITVEGPDEDYLEWRTPEFLLTVAAPDLLDALRQAVEALNTAPRFRVGDSDSTKIANLCDRAIAFATGKGKGGVQ